MNTVQHPCPCSLPKEGNTPLLSSSSRRSFIRHFSLVSATAWASQKVAQVQLLAEAIPSPAANSTDGILRIRTSDFFALQSDSGSVRIGVNGVRADHFPDGPYYPIIVNKISGFGFVALNAHCWHGNCVVDSYDDLDQGMRCPCHNSLYSLEGKVLRGPATRKLAPYEVTPEPNGILAITLPGFGFQMTASATSSSPGSPLKLTFPTLDGVQYELLASPSTPDRGTPVSFALQPDSTADQTVLTGTGSNATIYATAPTTPASGASSALFFSIRMVVGEV